MFRTTAIATSLLLSLSACAAPSGEFPSLLRRPYETKVPITAPVEEVSAVPTALPAELQVKVDAMLERHRRASQAFGSLLPSVTATARAATGAGVGSETWVNAHLQISRLDKARSDSKSAVADLDQLITAQMDMETAGASPMLSPLLTVLQVDVADVTRAQDSEIERLSEIVGM